MQIARTRRQMRTTLFEKYVDSGQMTMTELARRVGYTPVYLSWIRHGHRPVTEAFIARVCLRLGRDIGDLFFEDVPEKPGNLHGGGGDSA